MMTFALWADGSDDAQAVLELLRRDDIWNPQARDGDDRGAIEHASFPGGYCAVFRIDEKPVGYILFLPRPAGVYEQHTAFIEEARGHRAEQMIGQAIDAVFLETPAVEILTYCPGWHPASRAMAKRMGGGERFSIQKFASRDGKPYGAEVYGMTILEWAWQRHMNFTDKGAEWHDQLFAGHEPHHEADATHDGFLGLALTMGAVRPFIAVEIYNAWATKANYAPARVCWFEAGHAVIDIGSSFVVNSPNRIAAVLPKPPCPQSQPSGP